MKIKDLFKHNWLIHKIVDREVEHAIKFYSRGRLLDIGCGAKPYKESTKPYVTEHIGLDREDTPHNKENIDIFAEADNIPLPDNSFNTILATSIFEHVEEPDKAISEMYRILKKDGYCIVITPFMWHLHEAPRDFYRYTKYGLEYLLKKHRFEIVSLRPIGGFWITFGQQFLYHIQKYKRFSILKVFIIIFATTSQFLLFWLCRSEKDEVFAPTYLVIARKK